MNIPEGWPTTEMIVAALNTTIAKHGGIVNYSDVETALKAALAAAPTPQAPAQKCKCDMRTKAVGDGCEVCNPELAVELAAQEDEPVAEVYLEQGETSIDLTKIMELPIGTKLYTRPADDKLTTRVPYREAFQRGAASCDKLRKAAEEVVHLIGLWINANEIILTIPEAAKVRNLHAALEGK